MTNTKRAPARTAEQRIAEIDAMQRRVLTRKLAAAERKEARLDEAATKALGASNMMRAKLSDAATERARYAAQLAALDAKERGDG